MEGIKIGIKHIPLLVGAQGRLFTPQNFFLSLCIAGGGGGGGEKGVIRKAPGKLFQTGGVLGRFSDCQKCGQLLEEGRICGRRGRRQHFFLAGVQVRCCFPPVSIHKQDADRDKKREEEKAYFSSSSSISIQSSESTFFPLFSFRYSFSFFLAQRRRENGWKGGERERGALKDFKRRRRNRNGEGRRGRVKTEIL